MYHEQRSKPSDDGVIGPLPRLESERFRAFPLTPEHGLALARLLDASADYSLLVMGRAPEPGDANTVYMAGPEDGREPGDKVLLGIEAIPRTAAADELSGVLDAFRDYPEPGVWYIGLLLFSPEQRGRGLGEAVVEAFAAAAKAGGAHELQLNVVEQNGNGHRFWKSRGFIEARRWRARFGERESIFIRMRRPL
ncbi:MAG: GNAT family N-acetyltransferase [Candidatus Eremiobacteraeota bacterium]|nr:GNAT family N-acetyltransferase [Candidatus Eremiobacteraeota bacterium]